MTNPDKDKSEEDAAYKILHVPDGRTLVLSEEDVAALKNIIYAWKGFEAIGKIGGILKKILMWIGFIILAFVATETSIVDFIKSVGVGK